MRPFRGSRHHRQQPGRGMDSPHGAHTFRTERGPERQRSRRCCCRSRIHLERAPVARRDPSASAAPSSQEESSRSSHRHDRPSLRRRCVPSEGAPMGPSVQPEARACSRVRGGNLHRPPARQQPQGPSSTAVDQFRRRDGDPHRRRVRSVHCARAAWWRAPPRPGRPSLRAPSSATPRSIGAAVPQDPRLHEHCTAELRPRRHAPRKPRPIWAAPSAPARRHAGPRRHLDRPSV